MRPVRRLVDFLGCCCYPTGICDCDERTSTHRRTGPPTSTFAAIDAATDPESGDLDRRY